MSRAALYDYDIFVIGGGSGGVRAARLCAAKGLKTALTEEYRMGGTCVIRGCVPKKLFAYAAGYARDFADAAGFGWDIGEPAFNWPRLRAAKDKEIARLSDLYQKNLEKSGAVIYAERAELAGKHQVKLAGGKVISAETILIAAGSRPFIPRFAGAELCITSNEIFNLEDLPESIIIAGGGYIAVEFASILRGLGVDVTLVYRSSRILRHFDSELSHFLQEALEARGIKIICNAVIEQGRKDSAGAYEARLSDGSIHWAGQVMLALGRRPNTDRLGLDKAGIKLETDGAIPVNQYLQTAAGNIYALGDVLGDAAGRMNLTPVAIHEAMCFVKTLADKQPAAPDYNNIPTAVFSEPELGTAGLTEEEAVKKFAEVAVYRAYFCPLRGHVSGNPEKMLMKLLTAGIGGRIIGAHILGESAAEMTQLLAVALKGRMTKAVFDATMALHPSAAEELVTMHEPSYVYRDGRRVNPADF